MEELKASRLVCFDVDDTLVMWDWQSIDPEGKGLVKITNYDTGHTELVLPHHRHIKLMAEFHARGHTVIVWSQGGSAWAASVCKTLGIDHMVKFAMDKPHWYVDDLHVNAWMRAPIFLDPLDPAKDSRWGVTPIEPK